MGNNTSLEHIGQKFCEQSNSKATAVSQELEVDSIKTRILFYFDLCQGRGDIQCTEWRRKLRFDVELREVQDVVELIYLLILPQCHNVKSDLV